MWEYLLSWSAAGYGAFLFTLGQHMAIEHVARIFILFLYLGGTVNLQEPGMQQSVEPLQYLLLGSGAAKGCLARCDRAKQTRQRGLRKEIFARNCLLIFFLIILCFPRPHHRRRKALRSAACHRWIDKPR